MFCSFHKFKLVYNKMCMYLQDVHVNNQIYRVSSLQKREVYTLYIPYIRRRVFGHTLSKVTSRGWKIYEITDCFINWIVLFSQVFLDFGSLTHIPILIGSMYVPWDYATYIHPLKLDWYIINLGMQLGKRKFAV